ncbi:MAG: NAD(P)H-dependent oxidoreductase subunit E [Pseudomonadota bacterium]
MTTLEPILEGRRSQPEQLIEVLQDVQEICGYIPKDVMKTVARELGVPLMEVYRVANFYKAFTLKPRGKNVITVCTGTACHVRGSDLLIDQVKGQLQVEPGETTKDGLFTVECVNCLGACALAPIVVQNGSYLDHMTPAKLRKIIDKARGTKKREAFDA